MSGWMMIRPSSREQLAESCSGKDQYWARICMPVRFGERSRKVPDRAGNHLTVVVVSKGFIKMESEQLK
ncbi:unnamed protein product [Litomosoides sigmodontis]|uniref:Uncharacterized protein n=1 Tax=Litomosoides sigmodontis TaxID=42156 RepID=A0A3P6SH41_LITSI|nr:unnamed protein product [Litomosoides sigmodontis]